MNTLGQFNIWLLKMKGNWDNSKDKQLYEITLNSRAINFQDRVSFEITNQMVKGMKTMSR